MADLFGEWELAQAQGLEGNLGDGVNLAGIPKTKDQEKKRRLQLMAQASRQQFQQPQGDGMFYHPAQYDFMRNFGPGAQGDLLLGMANQATGNIARENMSRVAQAREARRMEHERAMMAMRMGGDSDGDQLRQIIRELQRQLQEEKTRIRSMPGGGWMMRTV